MQIRTPRPGEFTNEQLREQLYRGQVFKQAATCASLALAAEVNELLRAQLCAGLAHDLHPRDAQARLSEIEFFERIGKVREQLYMDVHFHGRIFEVIEASGFDPAKVAFDPLRLRTVSSDGHLNPRAAPVYLAHRDTWYGHPDALIAWWIPLDNLAPHETFEFFPDHFEQGVDNDSERFDYAAWTARGWSLKIGWQDVDAGLRTHYPAARGTPESYGAREGFDICTGQNLLFAGAQLHKTRPHSSGRTRFSLDFRIVHLADHREGRGAPRVDNRSRGSSLSDYVHPNTSS